MKFTKKTVSQNEHIEQGMCHLKQTKEQCFHENVEFVPPRAFESSDIFRFKRSSLCKDF